MISCRLWIVRFVRELYGRREEMAGVFGCLVPFGSASDTLKPSKTMPGVLPIARQRDYDAIVPDIFANILSRPGETSGCGPTRRIIANTLKM
ncbi:hypothetical protein B0T09DRAFT_47187 [Sordaria sp. MPI-SDFR-AT-0083]|nr:hypothetical protein B0T09DRAFT_47187 [Sordaria sp. MPI-SDFR-AT-0083]